MQEVRDQETLEQLRETVLPLAQVANPSCKVVGVSINTAALDVVAAETMLAEVEQRMGIPAVDPFRQGANRLVDALGSI